MPRTSEYAGSLPRIVDSSHSFVRRPATVCANTPTARATATSSATEAIVAIATPATVWTGEWRTTGPTTFFARSYPFDRTRSSRHTGTRKSSPPTSVALKIRHITLMRGIIPPNSTHASRYKESMRWMGGRESDQVDDERGSGFRGGRGVTIGCGTILLALGIGWLTGTDPGQILRLLTSSSPSADTAPAPRPPSSGSSGPTGSGPGGSEDTGKKFVRVILADTEDTWKEIFQAGGQT